MNHCWTFPLFLLLVGAGLCKEEVCTKSVINSCDDCIRSGPYCVWCEQLNYTKPGEQDAARCDTAAVLLSRGCSREKIISPQNRVNVLQKDPLSTSFKQQAEQLVQLSPQKIKLDLRPGLPSTFTVSFRRVQGYPVDLYYLMDLSYSMRDDLQNVKKLGQSLFAALKNITAYAQIGFGAFVDKTVLPFTNTNPEKLRRPCDFDDSDLQQQCQPAFGYRHVLSLTNREDDFRTKVGEQFISGNLDSPEGSLDAMMQAAVCGDKIGWRKSSTRLIVLTTDDGFHMAGDGKLAGILEPNDEQCHMDNNVYSKSTFMDYPSVGQLARQLEKHNIQPIFAVTKNMETVYKQLSKMIPKSEVGVLSADSNNVVQLIENGYKRLSSKVTLTHEDLPDNVRVVYTPICPDAGPAAEAEGVCENVRVEEEIYFNVTVTALSCMEKQTFTIRPRGIKDTLTVSVSTSCQCQCKDPDRIPHPHCGDKGIVQCGTCSCQDGYVGQLCECAIGAKDERTLKKECQRENGTNSECEGRGDCECGRCRCHTTESGSSYHGKYCECDDEHCEKFQNRLCGGNGKCICGRCDCFPGYEGSACQCMVANDGCRTVNNSLCYSRGHCHCNRCQCKEGYQRPHCQYCPGCQNQCLRKLSCIECLGFESKNPDQNCTEACLKTISPHMVEKFTLGGTDCRLKDSKSCWLTFRLEQLVGEDYFYAQILNQRDCPQPPNIVAIIGGSVAGVALIGLLLLLVVKLLIHIKDLKEYRKFEKERAKSDWTKASNPLYTSATTRVENPTFTGE